ncbi:dehydrogenase [Bacteroidia bacterium]|nr:dehydrogenase [Bacteroidia bacterium]
MKKKITRREFLQQASVATAGVIVGTSLLNHKSYGRILGANDRIRLAYAGVNSRGSMLIESFSSVKDIDILHVCDPEKVALDKGMKMAAAKGFSPKATEDFRTVLDPAKIDALVVAAPDHWHTAAGVLAARAGVNVYVEKPVSHNAAEGEYLIAAMNSHKVVVGVGSQRRSVPYFQQCIQMLQQGAIGDIYLAKGWYVNNRPASTFQKGAAIPEGLNWDLWQGPAPRVPYIGGVVHYDWHWTWRWGSAEAANNGPHEMDLMLWATGAPFPGKVTALGGKYQYQDSWECPDTVQMIWETPGLMIVWEGRSRNGARIENSPRGTWYYGTKGSAQLQDGFFNIYDPKGKLINAIKADGRNAGDDGTNTASPGKYMDNLHAQNFCDAVRGKAGLTVTPVEGHKAALYLHTGNIAQRTGRTLNLDPANGHILGDKEAQALFGRTYEKGWEPKV